MLTVGKGMLPMKWFWPMALILVGAVASGRTWTSASGTTLEADYVSVRNNSVSLRKPDGKTLEIGMQFLSQADRDFVAAQKEAPAAPAKTVNSVTSATPSSGSSGATRKDILTDEQVGALKSEMAGKKENVKYVFQSDFFPRRLEAAELRKLKDGEIPFRITAELLEMTTTNGKTVAKRMPGYVRFYVVDDEGKIVVSRREALEKMCPT
jgi:hypothetical protein